MLFWDFTTTLTCRIKTAQFVWEVGYNMTTKTRLRAVIRRGLPLVMFQRRRSAAGSEGC